MTAEALCLEIQDYQDYNPVNAPQMIVLCIWKTLKMILFLGVRIHQFCRLLSYETNDDYRKMLK